MQLRPKGLQDKKRYGARNPFLVSLLRRYGKEARRAKGAPRRATGGRRRQESVRGPTPELRRPEEEDDAGSGAREGGGEMSTRCRGHLALVLRVDGLAASLFRSLATPAEKTQPRQEE